MPRNRNIGDVLDDIFSKHHGHLLAEEVEDQDEAAAFEPFEIPEEGEF